MTEGIRTDISELEIPLLQGLDLKDEGYKHRTITIAAGIRNQNEPVTSLMHEVDLLLTKKDTKGRNRIYLRK